MSFLNSLGGSLGIMDEDPKNAGNQYEGVDGKPRPLPPQGADKKPGAMDELMDDPLASAIKIIGLIQYQNQAKRHEQWLQDVENNPRYPGWLEQSAAQSGWGEHGLRGKYWEDYAKANPSQINPMPSPISNVQPSIPAPRDTKNLPKPK